DRVDEHLVDLDDVNAELEDMRQAVVACADVVERDLAAEPLQRGDDATRRGKIVERLPLGDLEHDLRQLDWRVLEDVVHLADDPVVGEVTCREIEADLELGPAADGATEVPADLAHQRAGHLHDQAALLDDRDERTRRYDRAVG